MFEIYKITYSLQATNLLPPNKRSSPFIAWLTSLTYPIQWSRDLMFNTYANGDSNIILYNATISYIKTNRVRFNNGLYECILTPPKIGIDPNNTLYWNQIQADWRGVRERIKYNGQKLILEYVLNRWFNTVFRQPSQGNSDIWIQQLVTDDGSFLIGAVESSTAMIAGDEFYQTDLIPNNYNALINDFQVNYPLALMPSTTSALFLQLKSLVNQYKMYSTNPIYVGY